MAHVDPPLSRRRTVAVVGGGWAGCAAAATLAAGGLIPILLEAAPQLGGRARRIELQLAGARHTLDNGQHLMVGAYSATARLFDQVGVALDDVVARRPFELRYADGFRLQAAHLPAPLHLALGLLCARGLAWSDRAAIAQLIRRLRRARWSVGTDCEAAGWLSQHGQSMQLIARVWRPLAIAALNTPLAVASAQMLANVLRDTLGAGATASHLWLPRINLSALLPDAVERYVLAHGGVVRRSTRVQRIEPDDDRYRLELRVGAEVERVLVDAVVYAAAPGSLAHIGADVAAALDAPLRLVEQFSYQPICTIYLKYSPQVRIRRAMLALLENPSRRAYGQWVFDRGALDRGNAGVLAVVISAGGPHDHETLGDVCQAVSAQLTGALGLPAPLAARAVVERRATLAAVPALRRPGNATAQPGFVLAGDWTDRDSPSTLESAVRSGVAAAQLLLR
jgi:squalene-associated FAD-dependent desaturase